MSWVRIVLGLALLATALWLLSALAVQAGTIAAVASGLGAIIAAAALALGGHRRGLTTGLAAVVGLAAIAAPLALNRSSPVAIASEGPWRPWDRVEAINQVAAGKTVFVHVTAEWCLNCKVNEALVLDRGAVAQRLKEPGTVAMTADWTRSDPRVNRLLADFGRYGIPFDVVYGPKAPAGIALPEILSQDAVLKALDAAGGKGS
jgi:suppressor for copper-sensitivity B